ncbi:hypothetical protein [Rhizorhabdus dicambivorans]|uniref:Uncharacterized protein n=1 Tax=Rhizorhabdus dicambivorans TaxID=1850238 RepID=A0A2A4G0R3_9SPHN|nr:hypothetical protein [Rhizorhabdus dicambivorans]ATE63182.1 hypothetical protein CMV14_01205 [Rhizorhabdus dicambivorans]PCE43359.1 hypothetical protein COO09_06250 [Rhizorhabdus dicambivorans]
MTAASDVRADTKTQVPPLSALEWKVVSLAIREAGEMGCGAGKRSRLARLFGGVSGFRPKLPLADPRLETLRRFVCTLRDGAELSELKRRLIEFGFHPGQLSAVAMLAR